MLQAQYVRYTVSVVHTYGHEHRLVRVMQRRSPLLQSVSILPACKQRHL